MADELFQVVAEPDEPGALVYQHAVLAQTCLPYRNPGDECRVWDRANGAARLRLTAGSALHPGTGEWVSLGLPYGPKPRLILAHLNAEAVRTHSPEIEVEASLTAFVRRIQGRNPTGPEIRLFKDQLARLATAEVRLAIAYSKQETRQVQAHLIGAFNLWFPKTDRQRVLWPSSVRLSLDYYESLARHAVPLHERALAALAHNAMALDVYAWLAQRLHRIDVGKPQLVTWAALKDQFGWHYDAMFKFRQVFRSTLEQVLIQYAGARLELDHRGMILHQSPPPVLCRRSPVITGSKGSGRSPRG